MRGQREEVRALREEIVRLKGMIVGLGERREWRTRNVLRR